MAALVANNASSTLVGGLTTVATTLTVLANTGDVFPDVVAADSNWFLVTIIDGDKLSEIVKCTARNADELTIERGQEGTNALSFEDEDKVELRLTAGVINSFLTTTPGFNDLVDLPEAFKPAYEEAELYGRTLSDIRSYYFPTAYDANTDLLSISYAYIGVASAPWPENRHWDFIKDGGNADVDTHLGVNYFWFDVAFDGPSIVTDHDNSPGYKAVKLVIENRIGGVPHLSGGAYSIYPLSTDFQADYDALDSEIISRAERLIDINLEYYKSVRKELVRYYNIDDRPTLLKLGTTDTDAASATHTHDEAVSEVDVLTPAIAGIMSSGDKYKLDGIDTGANNYIYNPPAFGNAADEIAEGNHTHAEATTGATVGAAVSGIMSAADKFKLDGIATNATATAVYSPTEAIPEHRSHCNNRDWDSVDEASCTTTSYAGGEWDPIYLTCSNPSWDGVNEATCVTPVGPAGYTGGVWNADVDHWWTGAVGGTMSYLDKDKLDNIETDANNYSPTEAVSATADADAQAGILSVADKTKLDDIAAGAEVNVQTNWTETDATSDGFITNKPASRKRHADLDNGRILLTSDLDATNFDFVSDSATLIDTSTSGWCATVPTCSNVDWDNVSEASCVTVIDSVYTGGTYVPSVLVTENDGTLADTEGLCDINNGTWYVGEKVPTQASVLHYVDNAILKNLEALRSNLALSDRRIKTSTGYFDLELFLTHCGIEVANAGAGNSATYPVIYTLVTSEPYLPSAYIVGDVNASDNLSNEDRSAILAYLSGKVGAADIFRVELLIQNGLDDPTTYSDYHSAHVEIETFSLDANGVLTITTT